MPKRLKFVIEQWVLFYDGKRGRRGDLKFSNRPVTLESLEASQVPSFYVCISIQKILKGSFQPKLKRASVWLAKNNNIMLL